MNTQVNIANMNAVGGPVGGAAVMNNGGQRRLEPIDPQALLNTYIYDYFLRNEQYDLAKMILSSKLDVNTEPDSKPSPNNRVNGVDDMDTDSKDDIHKRPSDLPRPKTGGEASENSFLLDWWCQFWDIFSAQRSKGGKNSHAQQYLHHSRTAQHRMMMAGQMPYNPMMQRMSNGLGLSQKAMQNNQNAANNAQLHAIRQQQQQQQQQQAAKMMMPPRDGSGMEMGQRPQSPTSAENAPSPSKRQRLEGGQFNGQGLGPGRSQGMQGPQMGATSASQGNQMMLPNGINPNDIPPNQFNSFQSQNPNVQGKAIEGMNAAAAAQGSPMAGQSIDGEMFAGNPPPRGPGGPQSQGNHALQDYQMQLMLLEQQNKKRLLMARQEQDNMTQAPHAPGVVGQPGFAQAMSPQGSRAGPSPNPNDQMKRGTPKMGQTGLPGSPMPDGSMQQSRGSPIPNFDPSHQMPPNISAQYYNQMGANMRPPSSHPNPGMPMTPQQLEALRRTGQAPAGMWSQGVPAQMMPTQGQQPGQVGTPQQRTAMPPPPAPAAGAEAQRTQPSSPSQQSAPAPPTPSQATKPNPKGKKDNKETKKKPQKKGTTGATPAAEPHVEQPTPTPSTPITPINAASFHQKNGQPNANANSQEQVQTGAAPPQLPTAQVDPNAGAPFGALDNADGSHFNLDFTMDGPDVLESFDFESFLQTDENTSFDMTSGFGGFGDGVEAGTNL